MSQRKFMGLVGGATASGPGIAPASQRSANAAAEPAYDDEQEFPLIIANIRKREADTLASEFE
ncbi:hypothetical protein [Bradyrhizobium sp. CW1]|uniref:hypothetical protein n=1 Tax=Bradyrhizobium sp. CW1 TaxID=2782686 RepID=UPI001FFEADDB|nr:hypothetical protein [Bradyrhizobium sp. CW1]UPJ30368.1 hypothetical protein IVB54_15885 [Bradyrhizobium sp. CW1]